MSDCAVVMRAFEGKNIDREAQWRLAYAMDGGEFRIVLSGLLKWDAASATQVIFRLRFGFALA